jgi:hypothetical protein
MLHFLDRRKDGRKEGKKEGRTEEQTNNIPTSLLGGGVIIYSAVYLGHIFARLI